MVFQVVAFLCCLVLASAAPGYLGGYAAPAAVVSAPAIAVTTGVNSREIYRAQDGFGNYVSGYAVSDSLTGDHKSSHEQNFNGAVVGSNSQLDPNGYIRRNDYVADAFGNRQVITGSENGLYVNTPFYAIRPYDTAVVAAPAVAYSAPAVAYSAPALATSYSLGHNKVLL